MCQAAFKKAFLMFFHLAAEEEQDQEYLNMVVGSGAEFSLRVERFVLVLCKVMDLHVGLGFFDEKPVAALWRYMDLINPTLVIGSPERAIGFQYLRIWLSITARSFLPA